MKVLMLARYGRLAPGSRIRSHQFVPVLRSYGLEVTASTLLEDDFVGDLYTHGGRAAKLGKPHRILAAYLHRVRLLLTRSQFDLLWIEKELFPWIPAFFELLLTSGVPYIIDFDEPMHHYYGAHRKWLVRELLGNKVKSMMRHAAAVVVGNRNLGEYAAEAGARRIEYIPSVVDIDRYSVRKTLGGHEDEPFTVGWMGTPSTVQYLPVARDALQDVCRPQNGARLLVVGSGPMELDGIEHEIRPWSEETENQSLQDFDVGIMPLTDNPWDRGKSGYKLIQYMACGCPVIASPVGCNADIVEEGVNGFLASSTEEWVVALNRLRRSPELRLQMGSLNRSKIESQYSLQVAAPKLAALFHELVGS